MNDIVHIACCFNDAYAEHASVTMISVAVNTDSSICFHLISEDLSVESKKTISDMFRDFERVSVCFYDFPFATDDLLCSKHITMQSYFRLFIPDILPKDINKFIYLDSDLIVRKDIRMLWEIELGDCVIAAVPEIGFWKASQHKEKLGMGKDNIYYNAGVMLIDMHKYKRLNLSGRVYELIELLHERTKASFCHDQDIINYLLFENSGIKFLDYKFNANDRSDLLHLDIPHRSNYTLKELGEAFISPIIAHFMGAEKPWDISKSRFNVHFFTAEYYKYKSMTPFWDKSDDILLEKYNQNLYVLRNQTAIFDVWYISMFWRDIFSHSAKLAKHKINGRKLVFWGCTKHLQWICVIFAYYGLKPHKIVDGLAKNQGKTIFEYNIENAETVFRKKDEFFIVTTMKSAKKANEVVAILDKAGYREADYCHAFDQLWEKLI